MGAAQDAAPDNNDNKRKEPGKAKSFVKPSVEEIAEYCRERKNGIDAQKFFDYYESKGWIVGKAPMKDWKAAVRIRERSDRMRPRAGAAKHKQKQKHKQNPNPKQNPKHKHKDKYICAVTAGNAAPVDLCSIGKKRSVPAAGREETLSMRSVFSTSMNQRGGSWDGV